MNLPYIQSELFRELVGMETLLKPRHHMSISSYQWVLSMGIFLDHHGISLEEVARFSIDCRTIKTPADITAEINRIWNAIPAEYKKPNTWI